MTKQELKRQCCICNKITYNADTLGTHLRSDDDIKKKYRGKWIEYKCIDEVYK